MDGPELLHRSSPQLRKKVPGTYFRICGFAGHDLSVTILGICGFSVRWCYESIRVICVICGLWRVRCHRALEQERGAGRQLGLGRL